MEDGSPLMVYSQQQRQALAARLAGYAGGAGDELRFAVAGERG
jgi:hypothetical protein